MPPYRLAQTQELGHPANSRSRSGQHENNVMFPVILIQVEILIACPKFLMFVRHLQLLVNYGGLFRADAGDADAAVTVRLLIPEFIEVASIPFPLSYAIVKLATGT